jgi:hypothetical protein
MIDFVSDLGEAGFIISSPLQQFCPEPDQV